MSGKLTSEDLNVEAERFASAVADEVEERRNDDRKSTAVIANRGLEPHCPDSLGL
jgi:hypothetical protein